MLVKQERGQQRFSWLAVALLGGALAACGPNERTPEDAGTGEDVDSGVEADAGEQPETDAGVPDTDIAVFRLNTDGTLDTAFGTDGIAMVSFSEGLESATDSIWDMKVDSADRVVLFGQGKAPGERTDVDRYVARLSPTGQLDTNFATDGLFSFDSSNGLKDNGKNGIIEADDSIVSAGYTNQPTGVGTQSANSIVLVKLDANGDFVQSFGEAGVINSNPFSSSDPAMPWGMAEAYGVGRQSTGQYVTTGYGRAAASGTVDLVSFRYGADGVLDTMWADQGQYVLDVAADNDRGRNIVVLNDDRVVMAGSASVAPSTLDAMLVVLGAGGRAHVPFSADGYRLFDLGSADEAFFGVAASEDGNWVAAAGYTKTAEGLDGALLITPVGVGVAAEFIGATPLSADSDDRFWTTTFAGDKVYAAGSVKEGSDQQMVVARFNLDGTLDTTFGESGVVRLNVAAAESDTVEGVRGIAVQSDGKIVLAGAVQLP